MNVARDFYLKQLVDSMWDGQVKDITGLRRCGKSYLLKNLHSAVTVSERSWSGTTSDIAFLTIPEC